MITQNDRNILRDSGREYLLDIAMKSDSLRNKLTFREHVDLCKHIAEMPYEDIIATTITESLKEFEGKFRKFLKYGFAQIAGLGIGAAASGIGGAFGGPPLAMFVLYIFRKLTDTCSRSCLKNIPLSTKRKICRYECQVNAARNIVRDMRNEISKCAGDVLNRHKCEKKLQGEYIKWSKRLQQQMIKLHQAKLGVEEKERKKRGKELQKKARTIMANYQIPKSQVLNMIAEDKRFRQLPFKYHIELYKTVSSLQQEQKKSHEVIVKPPKINAKTEKHVRNAAYLGLWVIPIPFFNDVVNHFAKKYNFACIGKCAAQRKFSQELCRSQCTYLSARYTVGLLNKELSKCNKADNPVKCKKRMYNMLEDWKQREVDAKIKYNLKIRSEIGQAKDREAKAKAKQQAGKV